MSRIRIVGGTITKTSTGATIVEVLEGHFKSSAGQQNHWVGDENGNTYHEYKATEKKEEEPKETTFTGCIQFYRSKENAEGKYGVADSSYKGSFGFDKFDKKVCAEGLIGEYEDLKNIVPKTEIISGRKKYLCAYLSIWPPNVEGNQDNAKSKVTLYVKAEEVITKLGNSSDIEFICSDANIIINGPSTLNLTLNEESKPLTIECKGPFEKDVFIEARVKGESKILGKLIIKANAIIYKTIIQPVEVSFGLTENFGIPDISHTTFIQNLVKDFNSKSFNQAYIYGELALTTKKIALNKSEFENKGLLSTKEDGKLYLKKDSETDQSTRDYNDKIEERYAASLIKGGLEKKKAEERLKMSVKEVLIQFGKEYSFKKDGDAKYTMKQYQDKIATKAWDHPKVQKAYQDYKISKSNYDTIGSNSIGLNKTGMLHFFYTNDIHAGKNPESKVLAYSSISSGVAHIFESAIKSQDANSVILHELGHSLSLHHSFDREDLGTYSIKEIGKRYKDDIEKEIAVLEGDKKTGHLGEIRILENDKKNIEKNQKTNVNEIMMLSRLKGKYSVLQHCLDAKNSFEIEYFESTFIRHLNSDNESAVEIEANSLDVASDRTSLSVTEIDMKINEAKEKLIQLQIERKNAEEVKKYSKATSLSKTQENYMDYYQDSSGNTNSNFERKSYYQWQWSEMQKTGKQNNYFKEVK